MAGSVKRVVWDAAAWIALISDEKIYSDGALVEDRGEMARGVIRAAERGLLEIVTPALALVEVCGPPDTRTKASSANIGAFFDHGYIQIASVDTTLSTLARSFVQTRLVGLPYCRPYDAVYVATAADWDIDELHTFDRWLIRLSGQFQTNDGRPISICEPRLVSSEDDLFSNVARPED